MTLHRTTELIHKTIKWGIILSATIIMFIIIFNVGRIIYRVLYPPPPDYPTVLFGKLPPISFPNSTVRESFTYSIETLTGTLPTFPDRVKIYKTVAEPVTLFNIKNAREKAKAIGFTDEPNRQYRELELTKTKYQWQAVKNGLFRTIVFNTDTYDFKLSSTFRTFPAVTEQSFIADEKTVKNTALNFLKQLDLPTTDIDADKSKVKSFMLQNGVMVPAANISSTQIMRVDLYQKDIEDLPVYYPYHPNSTMYFLIMARAHDADDVLEAGFSHQMLSEESATYPIKTAQEAFDELKDGKAFIANYFGSTRSIQITDITLGYYFGESRQEYSMPVILFQNNDNFFAFVPALKEQCLTTSDATMDECQGKIDKEKENQKQND